MTSGSKKKSQKTRKYFEVNEKTQQPRLWDATKPMFREKIIRRNAYILKKSHINNLTLHLKTLEKRGAN